MQLSLLSEKNLVVSLLSGWRQARWEVHPRCRPLHSIALLHLRGKAPQLPSRSHHQGRRRRWKLDLQPLVEELLITRFMSAPWEIFWPNTEVIWWERVHQMWFAVPSLHTGGVTRRCPLLSRYLFSQKMWLLSFKFVYFLVWSQWSRHKALSCFESSYERKNLTLFTKYYAYLEYFMNIFFVGDSFVWNNGRNTSDSESRQRWKYQRRTP